MPFVVDASALVRPLLDATPAGRALVRAAWRLRKNLSFYDALYVALAQTLSAPLVTADVRMACSAERHPPP